MAVAKRTSPIQFAWLVLACTLTWLGLGILAELSLGAFRPLHSDYRFSGVFHQNFMGVNCALLTMSALYLSRCSTGRHWLLMATAVVGLGFLLLTRSRTSLAAMLISIGVWWVIAGPVARLCLSGLAAAIGSACFLLAAGLGMLDITENSIAMGRRDHDLTSLTGRIPVWQELLDGYVSKRPLLGYGYGAFWNDVHIAEISSSQQWTVAFAHSAYIDLLLNVGYVGAILCVSTVLLALVQASLREIGQPRAGYAFIAMVIAFGLIDGICETTIGTTWFFSFFGICAICYLVFEDAAGPTSSKLTVAPFLNEAPRYSLHGQCGI
jgi:exopolysaccharide production protein ExoQ